MRRFRPPGAAPQIFDLSRGSRLCRPEIPMGFLPCRVRFVGMQEDPPARRCGAHDVRRRERYVSPRTTCGMSVYSIRLFFMIGMSPTGVSLPRLGWPEPAPKGGLSPVVRRAIRDGLQGELSANLTNSASRADSNSSSISMSPFITSNGIRFSRIEKSRCLETPRPMRAHASSMPLIQSLCPARFLVHRARDGAGAPGVV